MPKPPSTPPRAPSVDDLLRAGLQLHQTGRAEEAAAHYRRVLAAEPDHPAANHLLGLVLLARAAAEDAVSHITRAVAKRADPQYLGNLGVALNAAGRPEEAVVALHRAIAIKPDFAEAYSNLGMSYRELRQFDEAAEAYRQAIAIRPNEAGFHYNLANALSGAGDIVPAERSYRDATRLRPGYPAAASALGGLLDEQGRYDEGLETVEVALRTSVNDAPLQMQRARLLEHQGRLEAAVAGYDRALALRPAWGEARHHRANLVRHEARDSTISAMEGLLNNERAPLDDRIYAGFGLGKALSDIGDHDASVDAFLRANRMQRARTPFSLERAKAELQADLARSADSVAPRVTDGPGPIFVVGLPRAGKSTVEAILSLHPDAAPVRELPTMNRLYKRLIAEYPRLSLEEIPRARLEQLGRDYLTEARGFAPAGSATIDTMPSNYRLIGVILAAMPNARIVWCLRRPAEHRIAILEKFLQGSGHEYANDPAELAAFHAAYLGAVETWLERLPGEIHFLDVSQLRMDRRAQVAKLLQFCGLAWRDACLAEVETSPQVPAWDPLRHAANRAEHLAAWQKARPDLLGGEPDEA